MPAPLRRSFLTLPVALAAWLVVPGQAPGEPPGDEGKAASGAAGRAEPERPGAPQREEPTDGTGDAGADASQAVLDRLFLRHDIPPELGGGYYLIDDGINLDEDEWPLLAGAPGVRSIGTTFSGPAGWDTVGRLPRLEHLHHDGGPIPGEPFARPGAFAELEILDLSTRVHRDEPDWRTNPPTPVSAADLEGIGDLPRLRQLTIASDGLTDDGLEHVGAASGLLSLSLNGFFADDGLREVGRLTGLRRLSLDGDFTDEGLRHLRGLTELEYLELKSENLHGPGLAYLETLPNLRYLRLARTAPDLSLAELSKVPALEVLNLSNERVRDETLATLPALPRLASLSLGGATVGDGGLGPLFRLTGLEELGLAGTSVTDAGVEALSKAPALRENLRVLLLGESIQDWTAPTKVTVSGLAHLSRLRRLAELNVGGVNLRGADLEGFTVPSLRHLDVGGNDYAIDDARRREFDRLFDRHPLLKRPGSISLRASLFYRGGLTNYDFLTDRLTVAP